MALVQFFANNFFTKRSAESGKVLRNHSLKTVLEVRCYILPEQHLPGCLQTQFRISVRLPLIAAVIVDALFNALQCLSESD